jgi:hypothetical protein
VEVTHDKVGVVKYVDSPKAKKYVDSPKSQKKYCASAKQINKIIRV